MNFESVFSYALVGFIFTLVRILAAQGADFTIIAHITTIIAVLGGEAMKKLV
jgi:hypothetical protein